MRRGVIALALIAFLLGVAVGPILGWERQTYVLTGNTIDEPRLRGFTFAGWTVTRTDQAGGTRMVTFERPRVVGLWKSAGDVFNNGAGWLAWATGSGAYTR